MSINIYLQIGIFLKYKLFILNAPRINQILLNKLCASESFFINSLDDEACSEI